MQIGVAGFYSHFNNDVNTGGLRVVANAALRRIITINEVEATLSFFEIAADGTFPRLGTLGGHGSGPHQFNFPEHYNSW